MGCGRGVARTACAVTSCEEFFRVSLSGVAGAAEGFGHCKVDLEVFAVYMTRDVLAHVLVRSTASFIIPGACADYVRLC